MLSSIVSNNGIYADFEVDEQTYMQSIRAHADTSDKEQRIRVELTVQGDDAHPYTGTIFSFDNRINSSSGTIRARAKFDNKNGTLVPGMFVSVRLPSSSENVALLVPERAVGNDQSKKFVYVVDAGNKVVYREVSLGRQSKGERVVLAGVQPGDRVIVDGVQHVKPDATVRVQEVSTITSSIDQADARQKQAFLAYQQTILEALENMENALSSYLHETARNASLVDGVRQNRKAVDLAVQQYTNGYTGLLDVLVAVRNALDAEASLASSDAGLRNDLVNIYTAAGGGWSE